MSKLLVPCLVLCGAFQTHLVRGQDWPANGLYGIVSGQFVGCCGFGGSIRQPLPDSSQSFVRLEVDTQSSRARMTILAADLRTVLAIPASGSRDEFAFSFSNGMVFPDHLTFDGTVPFGETERSSFFYTVSNSTGALVINGTAHVPCVGCADIPTDFSHVDVILAPEPVAPRIEGLVVVGTSLQFRFRGEPPNDFFVEFSDSLPATNWLSLTNFRAKLETIEPVITDSFTNQPARFYRIRMQDCNCD